MLIAEDVVHEEEASLVETELPCVLMAHNCQISAYPKDAMSAQKRTPLKPPIQLRLPVLTSKYSEEPKHRNQR
jgi:hypothetical protein